MISNKLNKLHIHTQIYFVCEAQVVVVEYLIVVRQISHLWESIGRIEKYKTSIGGLYQPKVPIITYLGCISAKVQFLLYFLCKTKF